MKPNFTPFKLIALVFGLVLYIVNPEVGFCADPDVCPSDLMVLLRLDESSGPNYADYYGVHNATAPSSPTATTGKINGAQLFDESSKINIPDNGSEFEWSTNVSFSLECWIKTSQTKAQVAIGRYRTDAPETSVSWWLGLNGNGYATLEIKDNNNNNTVLSANTNLADNHWHHLVAVRNGATNHNKVYVDGVEVADMTADLPGDFSCPLSTDVTVGYLLRGNDYSPEYHFNGSLDEISIFTRALTAQEVASFYNGGSPTGHCGSTPPPPPPPSGNCPEDLLFLLRLDEASGPTYADVKGANDGIASISPTAAAGIVNGAQVFNEGTYVNIPDNGSDFEWAAGCSFSLEFWIKTGNHDVAQVGVSRQIAGSGITWWLGMNEHGGAVMELKDNNGKNAAVYDRTLTQNYADNQWHHFVGVKEGTTNYMALYVDGVLIEGKTEVFNGNFIAPSPTDVSIGYMLRADGSSFEYHVNGSLDEVAVFTRALSASEVLSFYNNGAPVSHCESTYKTEITSTPVTTAFEDEAYTYNFTASNEEGDVLTLAVDSKPAWLNFNWTPGQKSAVLSGTPAHSDIGTANVKLSVGDGDSILYQEFSIQVSAVNHIPVITGQSALSTNEDTPITLSKSNLTITDVDNPPSDLTLQVLAGSHYTFTGNQVTPEENFSGPLYVNVIVKDLVGQSLPYQVLVTVVAVNDAPVITTDPVETALADDLYQYDMVVTDAENDELTITATSPIPAWLTFTPGENGATLTGTPVKADIGTYDIDLKVNDGIADVLQSFTIHVIAGNHLPVITGQNSLSVNEDHSITLYKSDLQITDTDNPSSDLTLHVLSGSSYSFNGNTVTPDANYFGHLSVNVAVSDLVGQGPAYSVAITVNSINDAPAITSNPVLVAQTDEIYTYQMTVADVDYDDVQTLSFVSKPDWLNFNWTPGQKTAVLSGTPVVEDAGTAYVTLRVNDGHMNVDQSFSIAVAAVINQIPVITGQNTLTVNEDHNIILTKSDIQITDPDNASSDLTLHILAGNNYTFNGNVITPKPNYNGSISVNVVVNDLVSQSDMYPVIITINPVNDPPVITSDPVLTVHANSTYFYQVTVEDPDAEDDLAITVSSKPSWLTFSAVSNSALLMGIPTQANVGSNPVILSVNDGHGEILQAFVLTVLGPSSVDDVDNSLINSVYPNPANERVYFKFAKTGTTRIEIYDLTGNLLHQTSSENNDLIEINIADLPKGIYLYKAYQDNKISTGKISKN